MVKQFQVGKKYTLVSYGGENWTCEAIAMNGHALLTLGSRSTVARNPPEWSIVPPKPRTGTAFIYKLKDDKTTAFSSIFLAPPAWSRNKKYEEIPVEWKEIINDQDATG